ncbi:MAG TPA: glycosyltransferase family 4 protein, partial [Lacibacter sp.]|nr:glycosyltransferase family 4 protein [Lacibacter sp.]
MKRLAIITTHPIQYNAPLFQLLHQRGRISIHVFYTWGQSQQAVYDERFGVKRSWDVPLLDGYQFEFVANTSSKPDSNRFMGIINPGLKRYLKEQHFDAILIYRWSVWSHLQLMLTNWGKAELWFRGDSHLQASRSNFLKGLFKKLILPFVYRNVDAVFYAGKLNQQYFRYYGVPDSRLVFMPHAVDNHRFIDAAKAYQQKAAEERRDLSIPDEAIVFLYAGKFYGVKNLFLLVRAFQQLKGDQYRLLFYGSGVQEQPLRELAAADDRILFRPFQNQSAMPWVYRVGDVYVLPSTSETWGLGVNEAMACGLPAIVSSDCGCAPELIIHEQTGFRFQNNSEADLLQRLHYFTTRATAKQMGERSQQYIQQFS